MPSLVTCRCLFVHLFEFFSRQFQEWFCVSYKGNSRKGFFFFLESSTAELCFEKFSCSFEALFFFFIYVWWCLLLIFPSTWNFPSLQTSWLFPDSTVLFLLLFLFSHFSLWVLHIFFPKFYSNILSVYSYRFVSESPSFFFFFFFFILSKYLNIIHVH